MHVTPAHSKPVDISYSVVSKVPTILNITFIALTMIGFMTVAFGFLPLTIFSASFVTIGSATLLVNLVNHCWSKKNTKPQQNSKSINEKLSQTSVKSVNSQASTGITSTSSASVKRLYSNLPPPEELKTISYILKSTAHDWDLALPSKQKHLRDEGRKILVTHILRYITTTLTDPNLRKDARIVKTRLFGQVYAGVRNQYIDKLIRQNDQNNLKCYIDAFAADLKLNKTTLHKFADEKNWGGFVDYIFNNVNL